MQIQRPTRDHMLLSGMIFSIDDRSGGGGEVTGVLK